ncbi:unnamed protein product [Linum trigynum]|uniref:Uncharacterized protein n=1 Tax=Linum trigynum TaxID=586398 RepID=A0AAV2FU55_9ROSI
MCDAVTLVQDVPISHSPIWSEPLDSPETDAPLFLLLPSKLDIKDEQAHVFQVTPRSWGGYGGRSAKETLSTWEEYQHPKAKSN